MTGPAIGLLLVSALILWGGLSVSIAFIRARPEVDEATLPPLADETVESDERREQQPHPTRDT
ncbi:MAG: MetS family NSS transporter small subunit [Gordonia sp. (in: high G+C Gram-positive bacteria)]|uniref:MetS family NSS transporter small subunit n=1 Tax=Gordonia sp. (in: high G+C Gram-positive bacteria) TaxID=84139 RepID=UPI003BB4AB77